jgi:hypothetical protein
MTKSHRKRLPHIIKKRFESEIENGYHSDAIKVAKHFKWLFPENKLLEDVADRCIKEGGLKIRDNINPTTKLRFYLT